MLLAFTLIFGREHLPEWVQVKVAAVEGRVLAMKDAVGQLISSSF